MTTNEDLKAEFNKWWRHWLQAINSGKCVSTEEAFMKGAEIGEAIGYQKGRLYGEKRVLGIASNLSYNYDVHSEVRRFFAEFEEATKEPNDC